MRETWVLSLGWEDILEEGNGTPLQYSCLENPMGRGAWWAAVYGVVKSQTQLSNFTFTFHFHALEKEMATHSSVLAWRIPGMGSHRVRHGWSDLAAAAAAKVSEGPEQILLSTPYFPSLLPPLLLRTLESQNYILQKDPLRSSLPISSILWWEIEIERGKVACPKQKIDR